MTPLARAAFAACLALAAGGCRDGGEPLLDVAPGTARGADVVLITLDTVRADFLGCYGHTPSVTPNLDRLCADGVRFDNAVTPAPITLPAHASLLTGLAPPHHGLRYNAPFALAVTTLADDLRAAGYATAAFVASFVLDRRFGLARGFDEYDDRVVGHAVRGGYTLRNERDADAVTDAALAWLAQRDRAKPVFLWAHYYDAHAPYAPRAAAVVGDVAGDVRAQYAAEIAQVDAAVGRLLADGKFTPERTLVVVAADHGESLGDHGERTHGLFLYDATTRVPLILRLPGRERAGTAVAGLAGLVDVRGSVLRLLGLTAPKGDGIDWLAARRGPTDGIYQEASLPYFDYSFAPLYAWRGAAERFVEAPAPEYYDLAADPAEQHNRYAQPAADPRADRARARLDAQRLDAPTIPAAAAAMQAADPAVTARLRSLGYLGGGATGGAEADLADPKSQTRLVDLHLNAVTLLDSGKPQAALALLDQARALSPRNEAVLRLASRAELALGRIEAAEATLRAILAIRPNPDSLVLLAQILILRNDYADAEALLTQAQALEAQHGGIAIARGDIAARQGDAAAARTLYQQAAESDPARVGEIARQRLSNLKPAGEK